MKSPFKFLDSFTLADRDIFFGRDQEITELYRRVFESKILLVYGISGTGKSSLVNCGLASRFEESDWLTVNIRRSGNMIESLYEGVGKHAITQLKENESFGEKLQSLYLDHFKPVFLIFDQFEELFIFGSDEEKRGFLEMIKEAVRSKTQCRIIFIIREEFLAGMTEFEDILPEIFLNRFRVEKMKKTNAIFAVDGPCRVNHIELETGFSGELLDKLCSAGNDIELTYLQIYLDRIFHIAETEKKEGDSLRFSKEQLKKAGSVSDLLGQFLEEQVREFENPDAGLVILKSFVSVQGTKKQMTEDEILDSTGSFGTMMTKTNLLKYLERFVELRFLRERDETGHFELRHDALAAKIFEKFTSQEKELAEVRLFIENAWQSFNARKTYLNHDDLEYVSTYEKRLFLPSSLGKFIQESKDKLLSQQRALRRLTSVVAVIFLLFVAAGVKYYLNKKGYAETKELTTLALLQEKVDPLTSINTAFKIRQKDSLSTVIQGIILNSFNTMLQKRISAGDTLIPKELIPVEIHVKGSVISMHLNKTGTHLFGWTDNNEVFICGVNDFQVRSFIVGNEVVTVEISPDTKYMAVVYKNSMGDILSISGKKMFAFGTTVNRLMNNRLVRFFPSGKYFMAAVQDNKAVIYDSTGTGLYNLEGHTGRVNSLDISPDGRFVATASCDKNTIVWNFNHKTRKFSPYDTLTGHKDTVWSCEFNNSGKYILTASADSTLKIRKLDGSSIFTWFFLANNSGLNGTYWHWTGERSKKFDTIYSFLNNAYNKRIFNAGFSSNNRTIIASNYSYESTDTRDPNKPSYNQVIYYDIQSTRNQLSTSPGILSVKPPSTRLELYQSLEVAPDMKIFASFSGQNGTIKLFAPDGYQLLSLPGYFPIFSNDGKYLLFLKDKTICRLPVNQKEIYSLVFGSRLFGNPEKGDDVWKIL